MKILITGINGQLGYDIARQLLTDNENLIIGIGTKEKCLFDNILYYQIDISEKIEVIKIKNLNPDIIIHCAAYTNVDKAEEESELAMQINYLGTKFLAEVAKEIDAKMIYISTEEVFNENNNNTHLALPQDGIYNRPLNTYGYSKLLGENTVSSILDKYFIIRTSWVFGINGKNLINTLIKLGKERASISVVDDQFGLPTYTVDLAQLIINLMKTDKYGYYHATNTGTNFISPYIFCQEIYKQVGLITQIIPIHLDDYNRKAKCPHNCKLDLSKLTQNNFEQLPSWKNALTRYLNEYKELNSNDID